MLSTGSSSGDLQGQISASQSAADSLRSQIAADTTQINKTAGGIAAARDRLATLQRDLDNREEQLRNVQTSLIQTRDHLVALENRLHRASTALAANLVAKYEGAQPDVMSVILDAHGFSDLLERMNFLQRAGHQDAQVVGTTRAARTEVTREVTRLAALEKRDRTLTSQILGRRNEVAAMQAALLTQQRDQLSARTRDSSKLSDINNRLGALQRKAARRGRRGRSRRGQPEPDQQHGRQRPFDQHRRDGPAAPGRAAADRPGDGRRQRDRHPALHLGRRPRLLPGQRL